MYRTGISIFLRKLIKHHLYWMAAGDIVLVLLGLPRMPARWDLTLRLISFISLILMIYVSIFLTLAFHFSCRYCVTLNCCRTIYLLKYLFILIMIRLLKLLWLLNLTHFELKFWREVILVYIFHIISGYDLSKTVFTLLRSSGSLIWNDLTIMLWY